MLDIDEQAAFEEWRARKLSSTYDLTPAAFNLERESLALSWEAGHKACANGVPIEQNPNRGRGMTGERPSPSAARITSTTNPNEQKQEHDEP